MNPITRQRWARIEAILDQALDLDGADLRRFLDRVCSGDPQLRAEIDAFIVADRAATHFLETPFALSANRHGAHSSAADESTAAMTGERIGPYRVVRELGRGGMGTIYLAQRCDGHFHQSVALKLIRRGMDSEEIVGRFVRERQILATLRHPCIARLLDGGVTVTGQPFFAMEYVEGVPITRHTDDKRLSVEQRVRLYLNVCEAVQHAHRNGVIHRDIKPSNIFVTDDGAVKLLDFGIAKLLEDRSDGDPRTALTRAGLRMMTPEYAAPEQVRGGAITPATDVYALGAVLYELLAGTRLHRFDDATPMQIERIICDRTPLPPSVAARMGARGATTDGGAAKTMRDSQIMSAAGMGRRLSGDLDRIVLKALDKDPARRYVSAEELADDLRRHLDGEPVRARRATLLHRPRTGTQIERDKGSLLSSGLALGVLAVVLTLAAAVHANRTTIGVPGAIVTEGAHAARAKGPERVPIDGNAGPLLTASASPRRPVSVQTPSPTAQRFYDEGLRAQFQGEPRSARRMFRAALVEDSTFALAAFRAITANFELGLPPDSMLESRVLRLAERLPDRERLITRMLVAHFSADPAVIALADTIVARYPEQPDGHRVLGANLLLNWRIAEAIPILRRAVAMDSSGLHGASPHCRGCEAIDRLLLGYRLLDSLDAAERLARQWVHLQPTSGPAWDALASVLDMQNASSDAITAREQAARYRPLNAYDPIYPAILGIRAGRFEPADRLLRDQARAGSRDVQLEALWLLGISLRYQGRFREALDAAQQMRRLRPDRHEPVIAQAQALLESGQPAAAAALFDSVAARPMPGPLARTRSRLAKWRTFRLLHVGMAHAAAGDTLELAALADTIERLGASTVGTLERTAHHHLRGLLHVARGDLDEAARSFYRATLWPAALNSPFNRTNLELARTLIALDRPKDAIRTLRPAFQGLEATSFYATHTDLHEALGRAWDSIGQYDSAAVHYRWVLEAWKAADPVMHARRERVQRRLAVLDIGARH